MSTKKSIYRYEVDSEKLEEISSSPDLYVRTASPNKKMVLYEQEKVDVTTDLYLLNLETKDAIKIFSHPAFLGYNGKTADSIPWDYSPAWSPDGRYFSYFTTPEPTKIGVQRLFITIYEIQTGNSISFEVPPVNHAGFWKNTYWIFANCFLGNYS